MNGAASPSPGATHPAGADIGLPAQPQALVRLSLLMADEQAHWADVAALVETDMALAAAVLKGVNGSAQGLRRKVSSVQQAVTHLGAREVVAITFELGLRAAFPPAAELEPLWQRAARRGALMAMLAQRLSLDAWAAHSAGLFEECGKAVLFRHASDHYRSMLRAARDDGELSQLERVGFGIGHDTLGAALCQGWGLGEAAVACVREHLQAQQWAGLLPREGGARAPGGQPSGPQGPLLAVSLLARALMAEARPEGAAQAEALAAPLAEALGWTAETVLRNLREVHAQLGQRGAGRERAGG